MKILCQSCAAKYTIADEKVVGKVIKIKCKKCGATIVVNGNDPASLAAQANIAEANSFDDNASTQLMQSSLPEQGPANPNEWTVSVTDDDQRTLTTEQIVEGYQAGHIPGDAFVWRDGMGDWLPLSSVPELMALVGQTNGHGPYAAAPAAAYVAPAAASPMAAAPMAAAPMAAAAPAAAARRAGGRGAGVDLFGGGGGAAAAATAAASHVGERNETSVLFSIGALKAAEEEARRGSAPIKAKASPALSGDRIDDLLSLGPAPTAPVLAPPPLAAPVIEAPPPPPPPSMAPQMAAAPMASAYPMGPMSAAPAQAKGPPMGLLVGGGVAALAVIGGIVFFVTRGSGAKPDASSTSQPADTSAPATTAKADDTSKSAAVAPSETAKADDSKPADSASADASAKADDSSKPADTSKVALSGPAPTAKPGDTTKKDDTKKDDTKKDDTKKDDTKKDDGAAGTAEFDRGAASAQLSAKAGAASGCKKGDGPTGSGKVQVTFAPSGHVTSVSVGPPFAGTPTGSCIAGAFHGASVPPFSGSAVTVSKTVSIH